MSAPFLFDRATVPAGNWPFLRTIENSLQELETSICQEIDLTENLGARTISGSIECYKQLVVRRVVELTKAIALLWRNNLDVGALVASRALLETIVSFHDFFVRTQKALDKKNYKQIDDTLNKFVFSSRDEDRRQRLGLFSSNHILDQIRAYGKAIEPKTELFYSQISDVCHPNGFAMLTQYGSVKDLKFIAGPEGFRRKDTFQGIYNAASQICWFYNAMDDLEKILDRIRYLDEPATKEPEPKQ